MAESFMMGHYVTNSHLVAATPVPDAADDERMHKYITDRRVIGVSTIAGLFSEYTTLSTVSMIL